MDKVKLLFTCLMLITYFIGNGQEILPSDFSNLELWFSNDSVEYNVGDSTVTDWYNKVEDNSHLTQANSNYQPKFSISKKILNNNNIVTFDGIDDFLETGISLPQPFELVILLNPNLYSGDIIGNTRLRIINNFYYLNAGSYLQSASNTIASQYQILDLVFSGSDSKIFINNELDKTGNSGSIGLSSLKIGKALSVYTQSLIEVAEIIVFSSELNFEERDSIHEYLQNKYCPPIDFPTDTTIYGFCDAKLSAYKPWYTQYNWEHGSSDSIIDISVSGKYIVTVTDIFGNSSKDSINVIFLDPRQINDTLFCLGDSILWDTEIYGEYSYNWYGLTSSDSAVYIKYIGDFAYRISDTSGCYYDSDTITISIDSFPNKNNLGPDRSVCDGESISLINKGDNIQDWKWNDNSTLPYLVINAAGEYSVTVTNDNGCEAEDTVNFTLSGIAPVADFSADTICFGDSTTFINNTHIPLSDMADSYQWSFGNDYSSTDISPKHLYETVDTFIVSLTVNTSSGCSNTFSDSVIVKSKPTASFSILYGDQQCAGKQVEFTNKSNSYSPVIEYSWDFDNGNNSTDENPSELFVTANNYNVKLFVTANNECVDSAIKTINVFESLLKPQKTLLIEPIDNYFISKVENLNFSWDFNENSVYYDFIIYSDTSIPIIKYQSGYQIENYISYSIPNSGVYYWQVIAYNICGDSTISNYRKINFNPIDSLPAINVWYSASEGVFTSADSTVIYWQNQISLSDSNYQDDGLKQPKLIANDFLLNNQASIEFDGTDDFLRNDNFHNIGAMYVVAKWGGDEVYFPNYNGIVNSDIGSSDYPYLFMASIGTTNLYATNTPWTSENIYINQSQSLEFAPINQYKLMYGSNENPSDFYNLIIGAQKANVRLWKGNIAEIIAFDTIPTDSVKNIINLYLQSKYSPQVNLGCDISIDGFADTTISAYKPWFTSYEWTYDENIISSDSVIVVTFNEPGTYSLTVTDIFGFTSSDTIKVTYPEPNMISDTAICRFDTVYWNTNLVGKYNYLWSTTDITPDLKITEPGDYWVKVTDTLGYSWYSDTITVTVDEFPAIVSLGNDTTLCSGNRVYLKEGKDEAVTYSWSNGSTDNFMLLQSAGEYSVTVTNSIGCIGIDTVIFGIGGVAPNVLFGAENFCLGDTVKFIDLSTPQSGYSLISWDWNFGDSFTSVASNPQHKYSLAGYHLVTLEVQSDNNCGNVFTDSIPVYNLPVVKFDPPATCSHSNTQMIDMSTSVDGNVMEWFWLFPNDSNNTEQNPIHSFDLDGDNLVKLQVKTEYGCVGDGEQNVLAKPGPFTDFIYSAPCDSQIVYFTDKSTSFLNLTLYYEWYVNGSLFSYSNNPSVVFSDTGSYEVKLVTTQLYNQCSSEANKTINILRVPVAAFDQQNFCVDNYKKLHENSYSLDAELSKWRWYIDSIGFLLEQNPIVTFASEGSYKTTLLVEDENGCTDTVSGLLYVLPNPSVSFTASPIKGAIPLNVNFENNTIGADSYYWDFDDESSSVDENPTHIFEEELEYNVKLKATALSGCSDSASVIIRGIDAFIDLAIISITSEVKDGYLSVSALIQNKGTLDMSEIDITYITNETGVFKEIIKDTIKSGYTYLHEFSTMTRLSEYRDLSHLCVRLMSSDWADNNPEDNEKCEVYEERFSPMAPYPNPVANTLISEYLLPDEALVTIRLVDLSGRISAILYKEISDAGYHRHSFDVRNISPGMYYFSIESNGAMSSYPIVVLRDEK